MRFNEGSVRFMGRRSLPGDKEGRLNYKAPRDSYRQRWFKLRGNLLYYFRTNDRGQVTDSDPLGVLVLEQCHVKIEPLGDTPFGFSIAFEGDGDRKHIFSGQTMQQCQEWVTCLKQASVVHLRAQLERLREKIHQKTGKDPMKDMMPSRPRTSWTRDKDSRRTLPPCPPRPVAGASLTSWHVAEPPLVNSTAPRRPVNGPPVVPMRSAWASQQPIRPATGPSRPTRPAPLPPRPVTAVPSQEVVMNPASLECLISFD